MGTTTLSLRYAALSDVGRVRKDNQDSGFASSNLLVIADGVGGAARGDVASSTAVQILRRLDEPPPPDLLEALAGAVHRAHDRIAELVEQDPELDGTSTTVTAALFDGTRIGVAHIGDSRGYLLRDGVLSQLTRDHTFVQSLIDDGRISADEARTHPHRNLILRAVDGVHETDPDLFLVDLAPGDRILLCSDGCSGSLDDDRLADILGTGTVDYAAVELVRASLEAGSTDNVTCVVADVTAAHEGSPDAASGDAVHDSQEPERSAAAVTGPMLVGAVAEQPRRAGTASKSFFRGHRGGDTGELEPVPDEDAPGEPVDPEELRYAPRPPRRFVWLRRVVLLGLLLLVLAALVVVGYRWTQTQYYVAPAAGKVAIYKGVQADLPGLTLHRVAKQTPVTLQALPAYRAEQVRAGIPAEDYNDAQGIVSRLTELARICPTAAATPTPTRSPSAAASPHAGSSRRRLPRAAHRSAPGPAARRTVPPRSRRPPRARRSR